MDQKNWVRVIDYTEYFCRSWQYLYFEPRIVLYIRIVGTNNTVNKVKSLLKFIEYLSLSRSYFITLIVKGFPSCKL